MIEVAAGIIAAILGAVWLWVKGKQAGEEAERLKQIDEVLKNVQKANEVRESVRSDDADSRRERLREFTKGK